MSLFSGHVLPSKLWIYISLFFSLFSIMRCIVAKFLKYDLRKRAILITVLLGIFHSFISGFAALYMITTQDFSRIIMLSAFTISYFICDFLQLTFLCESNFNNKVAMIHHVCGIICIALGLVYPKQMPIDLGIYIVASELTMPTINLQWIIDTYGNKKKYATSYNRLSTFNIFLYFLIRISLCYWAFYMMICRRVSMQIVCTSPFVLLNTIWFAMLIRKYRRSSGEIF